MANIYQVEQLSEQGTTSSSFVDISGASLVFTPSSTSEIWAIFVSGELRSTSTSEVAAEVNMTINGTEHDMCGHQNNPNTTPNGAGFVFFDRITGTTAQQTIKARHRAATGTTYTDNVRIVAARIPDNADFQYYESDGVSATTGSNASIGSLAFTPAYSDNYYIFAKVSHHEGPSGGTSNAWFEDIGESSPLHPNAPSGTYHRNPRDPWSPLFAVWKTYWTGYNQTIHIRFTSSGGGSQSSEHRYRKIMIFRGGVFDNDNFSLAASQSTTTSTSFQQKNALVEPAPSASSEYLVIQSAKIDCPTGYRKSGELRKDSTALVRTDHRHDNSQYDHQIGVVHKNVTGSSVTYKNGWLSPDSASITICESAIAVFRYPAGEVSESLNPCYWGMNF